jgi:hypothetical protein
MRRLGWSRIMKMNKGDSKSDFDGELNADWWRDYLEEKERIRQLADKAFVEKFWELRVKSTFRWLASYTLTKLLPCVTVREVRVGCADK